MKLSKTKPSVKNTNKFTRMAITSHYKVNYHIYNHIEN